MSGTRCERAECTVGKARIFSTTSRSENAKNGERVEDCESGSCTASVSCDNERREGVKVQAESTQREK